MELGLQRDAGSIQADLTRASDWAWPIPSETPTLRNFGRLVEKTKTIQVQ